MTEPHTYLTEEAREKIVRDCLARGLDAECLLSDLEQREVELAALVAILPSTWFADRDPEFRLTRLVEQWLKLHQVNHVADEQISSQAETIARLEKFEKAVNLMLTSPYPTVKRVAERYMKGVENYDEFVAFLKNYKPVELQDADIDEDCR